MKSGRIVKALSGFYYVQSEETIYQCRGRGVFRKQNISPLVGDFVEFEVSGEKEGYILGINERKNELTRPPIANVEQAIIVNSALEPDFSPLLLDRFLVKVESIDIHPIIVITKIDLVSEELKEKLKIYQEAYRKIGYDVEFTARNESVDHIRPLIKDKISVVSGQSGVGKSALLNALDCTLDLKTGRISKNLGRGKHTTRHVELIQVSGGLVADTPGFSNLEFNNIEKEELARCFPEIKRLQDDCKFRACLHHKEPQCAIKQAVENGEIEEHRYEHYLRFLDEIQSRKPRY